MQKLIDVAQTAELLGISKSLVYELAKRRNLPCIRIASRLLFSIEALERFVEANSIPFERDDNADY